MTCGGDVGAVFPWILALILIGILLVFFRKRKMFLMINGSQARLIFFAKQIDHGRLSQK